MRQEVFGGFVLLRWSRFALVLLLCVSSLPLFAKTKEKDSTTKVVDSGKFGIFVNGNRVGTEAFTVEQTTTGSVTHCDLTIEQGGSKIEQKSDMQLAQNGDLLRYEWKELSPGKAWSVVTPDNSFLLEHLYSGDKGKPFDRPFLMPASTVILDDFFFTHRELLAWRYVGSSCKPGTQCNLTKTKFGGLIPHTASPIEINIEYKGVEKLPVKGEPTDMTRFDLTVDGVNWMMWMDSNYKVQRILVPDSNTEVLRD
ncbi:MAG TPA: hypothetical protein VGL89_01370 [Candidatus Koribacter sp.]